MSSVGREYNFHREVPFLSINFYSSEEAGAYLATYKAFEHKPPDMIKERVDKDYHAILRSALTSINKVNKMDVETLRTSFGVSSSDSRIISIQWSLNLTLIVICEYSTGYPRAVEGLAWLRPGQGAPSEGRL